MCYLAVTYQPSHPFGKANIKVKEQWRMQWSQRGSFHEIKNQRVAKDVSLVSGNMAKLIWVAC